MAELSALEQQVAKLTVEGRDAADIAAAVGIEERAVHWHLGQARRKLEAASELHRRLMELDRPR